MKRILFVAPSSYPINGPESMVNAKHIYMLCKMGYIVDLVCRGVNTRHISYPSDENSYLYDNVNSINVVSVDTKMNVPTLFRHLMVLIKTGVVYKGADWTYPAIVKCEELIKQYKYDFIFTKDYPSEIVGLYIAKKYAIKWIPTWNDPYMLAKYPAPYGFGYDYKEPYFRKKLIKQISKHTYCNLFPSDRLMNYMQKYMYGMTETMCAVMPHILVEQSSDLEITASPNTLKMIHTGSVGRERDPKKFLKALSSVHTEHPDWNFTVTFLGIIDRAKNSLLYDLVDKYDLKGIVSIQAPVPYNKCLEIVKNYDVCLIIEAACDEGIFLPSKVVDYLQNQKTIFSISPRNGVISDLHKNGVIDFVADVKDENDIKKTIESVYMDFKNSNKVTHKELSAFKEAKISELHRRLIE